MSCCRALLLLLAAPGLAWSQEAAAPFIRRPLPELVAEAQAAQPPASPQARRAAELVELTAIDPGLRIDLRYATADNFLGARIYPQGRAFLQRPVAEALARVNRSLAASGAALRILDAYRPWWVTKVFWEATEPRLRAYVANPAKGSVHNRGCAVDLDLVRIADGQPLEMPSGYDEMTPRSHADYPGGSAAARANRDLLRRAMAAEGFTVEPEEWWHYNHALTAEYPVLNVPFEAVVGPRPEFQVAGQVLLVTTAGWDAAAARLQRFEREPSGRLRAVGAPLPAWVGKHGMAWRSDHGAPPPPGPGPRKREGDGRAPAGLLTLGDLWGYAAGPPAGVRLPYRQSTDCDRCVDDPAHAEYAKLVRLPRKDAPEPWASAEKLRLDTEHYRHLVVIHYNDLQPIAKAGSCIFLHVAPPPGGGTAGCTALAEADLLELLRWLDPARKPLLVQVPEPMLDQVRAAWALPFELRPGAAPALP